MRTCCPSKTRTSCTSSSGPSPSPLCAWSPRRSRTPSSPRCVRRRSTSGGPRRPSRGPSTSWRRRACGRRWWMCSIGCMRPTRGGGLCRRPTFGWPHRGCSTRRALCGMPLPRAPHRRRRAQTTRRQRRLGVPTLPPPPPHPPPLRWTPSRRRSLTWTIGGVSGLGAGGGAPPRSDGGESKYGSGGAAAAAREPASAVRAAGDLLRLCPYAVPFATRVRVFHAWVAQRRIHSSASTWVTIRRARVFEDALTHLRNLADTALRARVRVKFIDEHGLEEAGIDGGGVFKEFMHQLLATALSPSLYGLFKATDEQLLYPNPASSLIMEAHLEKFAFLGKMLAKAVFDGILVDVPLAGFVLAALLGRPYSPNDLRSLDPELHRNMMLVKRMEAAAVDDMGLTFTAVDNEFGEAREVELVRGGRDLPVTGANRVEYIQRAAHHRLRQTREQTNAMRRGFGTLIDPRWSRLFGERELQLLLSGTRGWWTWPTSARRPCMGVVTPPKRQSSPGFGRPSPPCRRTSKPPSCSLSPPPRGRRCSAFATSTPPLPSPAPTGATACRRRRRV
eukprot:TRINITY_DN3534_c0_g1_i2.p1 TRINITY_DN3534_c0_g1~~TRINITY_DN3534_c0_g1_i2.p1  ORF type:complete len:561 (+),score=136.78 TRINITY_DN3534_c0_g1_i2:563-2245(+)